MLAQGELPNTHLAHIAGIARSTLAVWKNQAAFQRRVAWFKKQLAAAALEDVITQARERVKSQDKQVSEAHAQAAARAVLGTDEAIRQIEQRLDRRPIGTARRAAPVVLTEPAAYRQPVTRTAWENMIFGEPREPRQLNDSPTYGTWRRD